VLPSSIDTTGPDNDRAAGVFIGLGSNLGFRSTSPREILLQAIATISQGGDKIIATSSFWLSDAWPIGSQAPRFVNLVCQIEPYDCSPIDLLNRLHTIEAKFGRQRDPHSRWSARTLDLDLLDYNALIMKNCSFVTLPHERIALRDFVLLPLLEICAHWCHPETGIMGRQSLSILQTSGQTNNCRLYEPSGN
jgi:2-amino-4-hydroxy-6-hydroxymethyldihydropteridine diphosphokinase